jgi:hypothetical protein
VSGRASRLTRPPAPHARISSMSGRRAGDDSHPPVGDAPAARVAGPVESLMRCPYGKEGRQAGRQVESASEQVPEYGFSTPMPVTAVSRPLCGVMGVEDDAGGGRRDTQATALGEDTSDHRAPAGRELRHLCSSVRDARPPRVRVAGNSPAISANLRVFTAMFVEPNDFAGGGASSWR